jgi:hypothetical protein
MVQHSNNLSRIANQGRSFRGNRSTPRAGEMSEIVSKQSSVDRNPEANIRMAKFKKIDWNKVQNKLIRPPKRLPGA